MTLRLLRKMARMTLWTFRTRLRSARNRALVRRVLRSKLLCALSKKLKDRSKQEVLSGIVPRATTSKAKKVAASTVKDSEKASATASAKKAPKLSVVSKPSLKTKPSLKLKASAAKKEAKKHSKKKAADALAGKMVSAAKKGRGGGGYTLLAAASEHHGASGL